MENSSADCDEVLSEKGLLQRAVTFNTPQASSDEVHVQEISLSDIDASFSFVFAEEKIPKLK